MLRFGQRVVRGALGRWRRSLQLRVVATTMLLGMVAVTLLGTFLYGRIADGLERDRLQAAQYEAQTLTARAQDSWDLTVAGKVDALNVAATDIMKGVLIPSGPDPSRYVVMVRSSRNTSKITLLPIESGMVRLADVSPALQAAVAANRGTQQTQVAEVTVGSERVPAVIVGSIVEVPTAGPYELYFIYPMKQEVATMELIGTSLAGAGVILTLLLGAVAWVVTRQVVTPVRRAAEVAERLASGLLDERMAAHGEDDLALLATSFNEMADSLQSQIRQLEDLSQLQQRFVSDVSHELRTPLTTIRMAVDLIHESRSGFDPTVARSAELLAGELDRFEALLTDLLEISRFDAGAAVLDVESIDLRATVTRVVDAARPLAQRRGSEVLLDLPAKATEADVDERRVERILRNLVVNAIEHGEGRPIQVRVASRRGALAILVEDQGVGLDPDQLEAVFTRFWRADPARARTLGGTGLGLAISLEDARLHNGWLEAWGVRGVGSRFRLTLPVHAGRPLSSSPLPLEGTTRPAAPGRVAP